MKQKETKEDHLVHQKSKEHLPYTLKVIESSPLAHDTSFDAINDMKQSNR